MRTVFNGILLTFQTRKVECRPIRRGLIMLTVHGRLRPSPPMEQLLQYPATTALSLRKITRKCRDRSASSYQVMFQTMVIRPGSQTDWDNRMGTEGRLTRAWPDIPTAEYSEIDLPVPHSLESSCYILEWNTKPLLILTNACNSPLFLFPFASKQSPTLPCDFFPPALFSFGRLSPQRERTTSIHVFHPTTLIPRPIYKAY
ncbi:hypothetical protein DM02DRAFT_96698 [Periconia macrospinosa]|uniref:Uncharacterized protein n=1 Tax=Periconia macrospinosa TaxID=97972 RepID=A0A2V1E4D4_9PLEO|nr:hypothetical protein DM02DRAFT_96698 [Periconia macrospinosa]